MLSLLEMKRVSLWITKGEVEAVRRLAEKTQKTRSEVMREAIEVLAAREGISTRDPVVPDPRQTAMFVDAPS